MTASERLRELWDESADNPDASLRLANATLYLADVVEAAEHYAENAGAHEHLFHGQDLRDFQKLDGSLTALRDALQDGSSPPPPEGATAP